MIILENEADDGIEVVFITDAGKEVYRTPPMMAHDAEELAEVLAAAVESLRAWAQERRKISTPSGEPSPAHHKEQHDHD